MPEHRRNGLTKINRREALAASIGAAGLGAFGGMVRAAEPLENSFPTQQEQNATMNNMTWTLTDVAARKYVEEIRLTPEKVKEMPGQWAVSKQTLRGGLADGVDVIEVRNGDFRFTVLPTRGMGIWDAWHGDFRLGWKSPVESPVHPRFVHLDEPTGLGWLDGFNELVVRCGLEYNGGPEFNSNGTVRYGLHGKIANIPAHKVDVSLDRQNGRIAVTGVVDEARLFGNKLRLTSTVSTRLGHAEITISDCVTNLSGEPGELELLYHTNFGIPLLGPGAKIVLPAIRVAAYDQASLREIDRWNQYGPATAGVKEVCYFVELAADGDGATRAVLRNATGDRGVCYQINKQQLPYFTLWKNLQATSDGYATGLEPGTNLPNTKSFEKKRGRVTVLAPGESRSFQLKLEVLANRDAVVAAEKSVAELQRGATTAICPQMLPEWSEM